MYLEKIINVRENIKDTVIKTPLLYSNVFSKISNNNVYMKCENLQLTGAYKIRGALNKILSLSEGEKSIRVVCFSAGNHAQGVAYASSLANVNSTIVMQKTTPYVIKLEHNHFKAINRIHNVLLEVTVETNGHENIQKILNSFKEYNYQINVMY